MKTEDWLLYTLRSMKPAINLAVLAAAAAVAVVLVASRRERRPAPEAGVWEPAEPTAEPKGEAAMGMDEPLNDKPQADEALAAE